MGYENVIAANKRRATHGQHKAREHGIWRNMKQRCHNPNNESYGRYGARGITVCERWRGSFEAFMEDMGPAPEGTSIDRKDGSKGYEPDNCRWATPIEQQNNMKSNRTITHDGKTMSLAAWARETGIAAHVLKHRLNIGWPLHKVFSAGNHRGESFKYAADYKGEHLTLKEISKRSGVPLATLYWRFNKGVTLI